MAKTKAELLAEAKELGLDVSEKMKVAEIAAEIKTAQAEPTAKAGKRSAKGIKEAAEKEAKQELQKEAATAKEQEEAKPKAPVKQTRSRLERRGKKYREAAKLIDKNKTYSLKEAASLATETAKTGFDASVELHIRLGVDPRQADQNVRDTVVLPAGTGKDVRVAVLAEADKAKEAKAAGADIAGHEEFLQQLDKEQFNFDVLVAQPKMMPKLGKYARALGPKGLMPNPKSGTVTDDVAKAVTEAKAGRVEYRVDSQGIVHVAAGKVSFGPEKILENLQAIASSIKGNKPSSIKGTYVKSIYVTTSMGPSIPVESSAV